MVKFIEAVPQMHASKVAPETSYQTISFQRVIHDRQQISVYCYQTFFSPALTSDSSQSKILFAFSNQCQLIFSLHPKATDISKYRALSHLLSTLNIKTRANQPVWQKMEGTRKLTFHFDMTYIELYRPVNLRQRSYLQALSPISGLEPTSR